MSATVVTRRGATTPRFDRTTFFAVAAGGLAGLLVAAAVAVKLLAPGVTSPCTGALCPPPPGPAGLISLTRWRSDLGFQVAFDASDWKVAGRNGQELKLQSEFGDLVVWVQGFSSSAGNLQQLIDRHLLAMQDSVIGLTEDRAPEDRILGPAIGFVDGPGATYQGTARNASGPGGQEFVYVVAATDGTLTAVISAATTEQNFKARNQLLGYADGILNYFRFPVQG